MLVAAGGTHACAAEPPPGQEQTGILPVGDGDVRVVPVTVLAESSFREHRDWSRQARRGIMLAAPDLERLAGLRLELTHVVPWDPEPLIHTLPAALETVMRTTEPWNGITVIIVGDGFYKELTEPGVSLSFRGRPYTILVAVGSFRERLGRDPADHLAWLLRHELGHVFGVPDLAVPGIMQPDPEKQTWEFDRESMSIIQASRNMDFSSSTPFAQCDLEALRAAYLRLDHRDMLGVADLVNLGAAFHREREGSSAADLFERALRREGESAAAGLGLAQSLLAQKDSTGARLLLAKISSGDLLPPEKGVAGGLWGALGEFALADSLLTTAIAADSTRFSLWFKRGLARFRMESFVDARADFERALAVEARPEVWFNLGLTCDAIEDRGCATACLGRYLELAPEGPQREQAVKLLERLTRR